MMYKSCVFVDNNCYATRIVGEPERGKFLYFALVRDNKGNLDIVWVKENINSFLGVSIFCEVPIVVREVLQRFFPGDTIKLGKNKMKTYILKSYGDFLLLERVKNKPDRLT